MRLWGVSFMGLVIAAPSEREWRCLATLLIALCAELVLVRVTTGTLAAADALVSLGLGLGGASLLLGAARRFARRDRLQAVRRLTALAAAGPIVLLVLGIAVPVLARELGSYAAAALSLAGVLWVAAVLRRARLDAGFPTPVAALGLIALGTSLAWTAAGVGIPPLVMLLQLCGCGVVLAWLGGTPGRALAAPAFVAALVTLPPLELGPRFEAGREPGVGPDIVLVSVDALRADASREMESYQRLAAEGIRFEAAQSPAPWTLPSMATLLSGASVARHGAVRLEDGRFGVIDPGLEGLASRLVAAGYDTAAVLSANPFLGETFGFSRGFDVFQHSPHELRFALPRITDDWGSGDARPVLAALAMRASPLGRSSSWDARTVVDRSLELAGRHEDRPLFLWVHLFDAHLPYRHLADADLDGAARRRLEGSRGRDSLLADPFWSSEVGRDVLIRAYRNEVAHVDRAILRLLDGLGAAPARGRVVVLTSDHGEEFLEHGGLEHGHTLHQELLHVPLVIAGLPGVEPGTAIGTPVGFTDVATTLLRVAGADPVEATGRDLAGVLEPRPQPSRNLLYGPAEAQAAVRDGRWKLIRGRAGEALFDLETDPGERRDLATRDPERVARLERHLEGPVRIARPASR